MFVAGHRFELVCLNFVCVFLGLTPYTKKQAISGSFRLHMVCVPSNWTLAGFCFGSRFQRFWSGQVASFTVSFFTRFKFWFCQFPCFRPVCPVRRGVGWGWVGWGWVGWGVGWGGGGRLLMHHGYARNRMNIFGSPSICCKPNETSNSTFMLFQAKRICQLKHMKTIETRHIGNRWWPFQNVRQKVNKR